MFIVSYYTKKISPLYVLTNLSISVFDLENHATLKPAHYIYTKARGFRHLQNYTTLKRNTAL